MNNKLGGFLGMAVMGTVLFFASCSEQHVMEDAFTSQELVEHKSMTVTPQDSVVSLLNQARWGDGSAYLKLADCYRDGFGVKKDFFGMFMMAEIAKNRGSIQKVEEYICNLPDGCEFKSLVQLMDNYKFNDEESTDSVMQALRENDSPEAQTLLGFVMMDQGDTLTAKNLINEAANQDCSLAKLFLTVPDWNGVVRPDAAKLAVIAEQIPLAYYLLGNFYYEPDENGNTDKQLAVEYYMKAEEHAMLGRHGAERVLDYYSKGGNIQLTEDDVKRLELIVQPKGVETE